MRGGFSSPDCFTFARRNFEKEDKRWNTAFFDQKVTSEGGRWVLPSPEKFMVIMEDFSVQVKVVSCEIFVLSRTEWFGQNKSQTTESLMMNRWWAFPWETQHDGHANLRIQGLIVCQSGSFLLILKRHFRNDKKKKQECYIQGFLSLPMTFIFG